jgi:hypothetical protein
VWRANYGLGTASGAKQPNSVPELLSASVTFLALSIAYLRSVRSHRETNDVTVYAH